MTYADKVTPAPSLVRSGHNPERPALDTGKAAAQLGVSRQAVVDAIKRGSLAGYCLAGPKRMRWFVYADAIEPDYVQTRQTAEELHKLRERLAAAENLLTSQQAVAELQREGQALFEQAMRLTAEVSQLLVEAYKKSNEAQELASSYNRSSWVPTYPPGSTR